MPQTALTPQTLVGVTNAGAQFAPAVAALPGSAYVIAWLDSDRGAIYGQRYGSDGQRVGNEFQVSSPGPSPLFASVAALTGGGFVIAWQYSSFSSADIHAQRYNSAGTAVGTEFTVNSSLANEQLNVRVIGLDGGGYLFTWDNIAADTFQDVSGRIYNAAGNPIGPDFTINATTADGQGISSIAPLTGGGFVAIWQSLTPVGSGHAVIMGQRFASDGTKIGGEFQVNAASPNNPSSDDVARLSDGGFVVTWVDPEPNHGGGRVVARHYDASGNAIGGEIVIASKSSGGFNQSVVTALANGAYIVSWTDNDTTDNNVSARAMGSNDQPIGDAFDVSSGAPFASVLYPDGAATLANGHVVFTWDGPSTNTSEDVYFRMYDIGASTSPNQAPVNSVPGAQSTNQDSAKVITGLSISDVDAGAGVLTVTLAVDHGKVVIGIASGAATIAGNNSASVTITGTVTDINATLAAANAVTYSPLFGYSGADTLHVTTNDNGNSGSGGAQVDTDTVGLQIISSLQSSVAQVHLGESVGLTGRWTIFGDGGSETIMVGDHSVVSFRSGFNAGGMDSIRLTGQAANFSIAPQNISNAVLTSLVDDISLTIPIGANGVKIIFDNDEIRTIAFVGLNMDISPVQTVAGASNVGAISPTAATAQVHAGESVGLTGRWNLFGDSGLESITINDHSNVTLRSGFNAGAVDSIRLTGQLANVHMATQSISNLVLTSTVDDIAVTAPIGANGINVQFDNGDSGTIAFIGNNMTYTGNTGTFLIA